MPLRQVMHSRFYGFGRCGDASQASPDRLTNQHAADSIAEEPALARGTLFFVHSTGVRQEGYDRTLERIRHGVDNSALQDLAVDGICWGAKHGAALDRLAEVLP